RDHQLATQKRRTENQRKIVKGDRDVNFNDTSCSITLPDKPYEDRESVTAAVPPIDQSVPQPVSAAKSGAAADLVAGLVGLKKHPVLVMGVASDILFPA